MKRTIDIFKIDIIIRDKNLEPKIKEMIMKESFIKKKAPKLS